jgi:transposase
MLTPSGNTRIFLCTGDTDMRKSFKSLHGIIRSSMHLDPLSGYLFVFKNRRGDRIKVVYWDGNGCALWYKCLQKGTFQFPNLQNFSCAGLEIDPSTLRMILDGIDLSSIRRRQRYMAPTYTEQLPFRGSSLPPDSNFHNQTTPT